MNKNYALMIMANEGFINENLEDADFHSSVLSSAYFKNCNLKNANFNNCDLKNTSFINCNLEGTILDPNEPVPKTDLREFSIDNSGYFLAYRTENSYYMDDSFIYEVGKTYKAPYFSLQTTASCHPGLYFDTLETIYQDFRDSTIIEVKIHESNAIKCGEKYRCREFTVVNTQVTDPFYEEEYDYDYDYYEDDDE